MRLTQEQFQAWKEHPVTVHIFQTLADWRAEKEHSLKEWSLSSIQNPNLSQLEMLANSNRQSGVLEGLTILLDLEFDDTQEAAE